MEAHTMEQKMTDELVIDDKSSSGGRADAGSDFIEQDPSLSLSQTMSGEDGTDKMEHPFK